MNMTLQDVAQHDADKTLTPIGLVLHRTSDRWAANPSGDCTAAQDETAAGHFPVPQR